MKKRTITDPRRIVGEHPVTKYPVDLRWYRAASRANNGGTICGRYKPRLRFILGNIKTKPYEGYDLTDYFKAQS